MKVYIDANAKFMGKRAAEETVKQIKEAVEQRAQSRLL